MCRPALIATVAIVSLACGDAPTEPNPIEQDVVGEVISAEYMARAEAIRAITQDFLLMELRSKVTDKRTSDKLLAATQRIESSAETVTTADLLRVIEEARSGAMLEASRELSGDDAVALGVFEIALDHVVWLLTADTAATQPQSSQTSDSTEQLAQSNPHSDSQQINEEA